MNRPVRNSWAAVVGLLFGMLMGALLLGCSALEPPVRAESNKPHTEFHAETIIVDGTTRCVVVSPALMGTPGRVQSDAGVAISCDWKPAAPPTPQQQRSPYPLEPDAQPGRVVTR